MRFHYKFGPAGSWGSLIAKNAQDAQQKILYGVQGVTLIQFRDTTIWQKGAADNAEVLQPRCGGTGCKKSDAAGASGKSTAQH